MGQSEKDPEQDVNNVESRKPIEPGPIKEGPKLDAILPDDFPPAAAELVGDIDSYQKRMEKEWENAKSSYENKVNRIMEEFMVAGQASAHSEPVEEPPKKPRVRDERLKSLMGELEEELRRAGQAKPRIPFRPGRKPETMQLGWHGSTQKPWKKIGAGVGAAFLFISIVGFFSSSVRVQVESLPYTHTLGPIVDKDNIYILDWFRRSLYVHGNSAGLPIRAVEPIINNLATGLAMSEKTIWTLDALDRKILLHSVTADHQVTSSKSSPGSKPVGLFFDGLDLWSADQDTKKLYRHRGNDIEDIRDTFPLPEIITTAFAFHNNRLWLMDGKSRLVNVYRLQKPLLQLGSFDLDPFVKGSIPTGFAIVGNKILVVTENPPALIRIPLSRLKKSKTETF